MRRCRTLRLLLKCSAVANRLKSLLKRIVGDTAINGVIELRSSASAAASACRGLARCTATATGSANWPTAGRRTADCSFPSEAAALPATQIGMFRFYI